MATDPDGQRRTEWIRGVLEPCVLCGDPVQVGVTGSGVGHPMGESYEHYDCPQEALRSRVRGLSNALYMAESVCWALYRIEQVGERSVDPEADNRHLMDRWLAWKAILEVDEIR